MGFFLWPSNYPPATAAGPLTTVGLPDVTAVTTSEHRSDSRSTQNATARVSAICLKASPFEHADFGEGER